MKTTITENVASVASTSLVLPLFTEGPWEHSGRNGVHKRISPSYATCIAITEGDNREANARAIAAVPQMFAALERLEKACNAVHEVSGGTPQHQAMWLAQLEARDAIELVTGIPWQNAQGDSPRPRG